MAAPKSLEDSACLVLMTIGFCAFCIQLSAAVLGMILDEKDSFSFWELVKLLFRDIKLLMGGRFLRDWGFLGRWGLTFGVAGAMSLTIAGDTLHPAIRVFCLVAAGAGGCLAVIALVKEVILSGWRALTGGDHLLPPGSL